VAIAKLDLFLEQALMDSDQLIGQSWSAIRKAARAFLAQLPPDVFAQATAWYGHSAWEVRSLALAFLFEYCGDDPERKILHCGNYISE
jgi:hypothetical protein